MHHVWDHFSPFAEATQWLLTMLAGGLEGRGQWEIISSRRGLTLKLNGLKVCSGKDCRELKAEFDRVWAAAGRKPVDVEVPESVRVEASA